MSILSFVVIYYLKELFEDNNEFQKFFTQLHLWYNKNDNNKVEFDNLDNILENYELIYFLNKMIFYIQIICYKIMN